MAHRAPGKHFREGISIFELFERFPDEASAEKWFTDLRWPDGEICCPSCGSLNVQTGTAHKTMPYRCREKECDQNFFSVKTNSVMHSTKLPYRTWMLALYYMATNLKSVSSMKLHRDLGITQKSAWHLAHRLRAAKVRERGLFGYGPVEVDETYFGGKRKNMSNAKRKEAAKLGRGATGKTAVVGAKERDTGRVVTKVVQDGSKATLQQFVKANVPADSVVYTDESTAYSGLPYDHDTVVHSIHEYVRGDVSTNSIESYWSGLKRAHMGTFHKLSPKHLQRYLDEFETKQNLRSCDTMVIMSLMVIGMEGHILRYQDLILDNGLDSGARSG
ncbi:MAG: IS1595 family transposase [Gammaproteobacteria bacterium]|nr:IS1595 family transposase [Gammaproteobacteria bacterium]